MRNATLKLVLLTLCLGIVPAGAQEGPAGEAMEARIWLDRGDDPILQRGDRVRIYYRVNYDAYVALFHIDTDGSVTLVYPRGPGEDDLVRADRDYQLLYPSSSYWYVDEYPGKGYFFLVASSQPLSFDDYGYSSYDHAWDLTQVGRSVYTDPYVAMDDHVAHLIPDWESVPYALDFTSYDVGEAHEYPRFMCYQCHGYRSYASWDPYTYGCSAVRVVIWDDPYYYPSYRYQGTRIVLARSRYGVPRYQFKERGAGETWTPLVRTRQPPPRGVQYAEPGTARGSGRGTPQTGRALPRDGTGRVAPNQPSRPPTTWRPVVPRDQGGAGSDPTPSTRRRTGSPGGVLEPPRSGQASPPSARRDTPAAPPPTTNQRPTLQRRPTSILAPSRPSAGGSSRSTGSPDARGATPRTSGGVGVVIPRSTRPSQGVAPPSSPSRRQGSSGASPGRATPSRPTPSTARPATPRGRPALQPRPKTSSGGSRPVAKPKTGGSRPVARPKTGGGGGRPAARPPSRTGGGGSSGKPAARPSRSGGGGAGRISRPTRRGGGGAPSSSSDHRRGGG
ncbi:MAG: DUF4384 domain-containing protein [Gemmatimonadetes bacterium]|nr:DUF4384 domain-containing protein [Gemmatimonadota bacterium]